MMLRFFHPFFATTFLTLGSLLASAADQHEVMETRVITSQPQVYHGWPTLTRLQSGQLWVSWSGGREAHVCPFGQVQAMHSDDEGKSWTHPRVLLDGAIDDRDSGAMQTAKGTLVVTTFTSLAYEPMLSKQAAMGEMGTKGWTSKTMTQEQWQRWNAAHQRLGAQQRQAELGQWAIRSEDGGITWGPRLPTLVNSPHGPIQLSDGRLLYAGKELWTKDKRIGVCESRDDGRSWQWLSEIPARPGDKVTDAYHELHAVECSDGSILVQIRNHNPANKGWTLQCRSRDGGKTWSTPEPVCFGLPSHLLRLRSGHLLMTYGHRRPPFGNQARLSRDHGATWGAEMMISGDGIGGDLGYPSTVELGNGDLLTLWYEKMKEVPGAVLRQARWRLKQP